MFFRVYSNQIPVGILHVLGNVHTFTTAQETQTACLRCHFLVAAVPRLQLIRIH